VFGMLKYLLKDFKKEIDIKFLESREEVNQKFLEVNQQFSDFKVEVNQKFLEVNQQFSDFKLEVNRQFSDFKGSQSAIL
jgi:hypothetical protein